MKDKAWITPVLSVGLFLGAMAVRIYYIHEGQAELLIKNDILERARIGASGLDAAGLFANGISVETAYVWLLSVSCLLFGNFAIAGVWLNALLQAGTALFAFWGVKWIFNGYVGAAAGIALVAVPQYLHSMYEVSPWNLEILLCAAGLLIPAGLTGKLLRAARTRRLKKTEVGTNMETEETLRTDMQTDIPAREIKYIENPLPVPRRRPHKEMDYAVQPAENDDYDIKDVADKDFFDID